MKRNALGPRTSAASGRPSRRWVLREPRMDTDRHAILTVHGTWPAGSLYQHSR